jgi:hypothetical protein
MRLYLLKQLGHSGHMDCVFSTIVRASTRSQARELANKAHMDEGSIWEDPDKTSCEELLHQGDAKVIVQECNGF